MKKIIYTIITFVLFCSTNVFSAENFDYNEFNSAIPIAENEWIEFMFDSDISIKMDISSEDTTTIFEIDSDDYQGIVHYNLFTEGIFSTLTQSSVNSIPGYISIPHMDDAASGYIQFDYESYENSGLRNKTLKVRRRTIPNNISGWENAAQIGLNEEHTFAFSSMSDSRWYKLIVPDEKFKYMFTMRNPNKGCFIAELYDEESLIAGDVNSSFSSCISLTTSKSTTNASMGAGTYYIHVYPVPFYDNVLNTEIVIATDNKDSSEVVTTSFGAQASTWAVPEIEEAFKNDLIPDVMLDFDLTKKVNRGEFAAIAVQLYETLTQSVVAEANDCTFIDIAYDDNEKAIKQAYRLDVAQGTSQTTYEPLSNINREQLATMLCRVIKKYGYPNWTMETDSQYDLNIDGVTLFADDNEISDWAKPSVYFMSKNGIVKGMSDTIFAPKNTTSQQEVSGYASATREQAIILAQRIFENPDIL